VGSSVQKNAEGVCVGQIKVKGSVCTNARINGGRARVVWVQCNRTRQCVWGSEVEEGGKECARELSNRR